GSPTTPPSMSSSTARACASGSARSSRTRTCGATFCSPHRPTAMAKRDFLAIADFTRDEIRSLFDLAERMKKGAYREAPLAGKTLAMIFAKSSTRTRVSFEVGAYQLGGRVAWVSDGSNMRNSWIEAAQVLGFELRLACPEGFEPNRGMFDRAKAAGGCVEITEVPEEAVEGAHVVNTDVWASMGQEQEAEVRRRAFKGYTVDAELMKLADPKAIFLHCLPAHRGEEVTTDVIEGPQSRVWDEAENRLHVQKALLAVLMG